MTITAKIGFVSGTRQQPTLQMTVFESAGTTLAYNDALSKAITSAPATIFGATLNTSDVFVLDRSHDCVQFEMNYGRKTVLSLTRAVGATTKPRRRAHFFSPVGAFGATGDVTSSYGNLKWKVYKQGSQSEFNSGKPVTVEPLNESRTLSYDTTLSFVTDTYLNTIEQMVNEGVFNSASFWGVPAATLQLVSFSATEHSDGSWSLGFGMGYRELKTSISVGDGVVVPRIRGCDDYWPLEIEVYDGAGIQPKVKAVVVGQVWELDDFSQLRLPWQGLLATRTDDTTGLITTLYAHDITGADHVTLYWEGGFRLSANVSGVSTFSIAFSSGSGDLLPPAGTRLLAAKG